MKYERPRFIVVSCDLVEAFIMSHAQSYDGCGFIGCPEPKNYQAGAGCGHAYNIGACDIKHNT